MLTIKDEKDLNRLKASSFYILRPDCIIKQVSIEKFQVLVNKFEEFIEVDKKTGYLLEQILPMLNGYYSPEEMVNRVKENDRSIILTKKEIMNIIADLFKWGLVSEVDDSFDSSKLVQLSYFSSFTSRPMKLQKKLENIVIGILGDKFVTPNLIHSLYLTGVRNFRLIGSHIIKAEESIFYHIKKAEGKDWFKAISEEFSFLEGEIDLKWIDKPFNCPEQFNEVEVILILMPIENRNIISKINEICLKKDIKMLLGSYGLSRVIIGPYVIPFHSSCLACMESRYREIPNSNLDISLFGDSHLDMPKYNNHSDLIPFIMSYASLIAGYTCLHVLELSDLLINRQIEINYKDGKMYKYYILKSPRCPACSKLKKKVEYE